MGIKKIIKILLLIVSVSIISSIYYVSKVGKSEYLTQEQYTSQQKLFKILEVNEEDVYGKNLAELQRLIAVQYRKLSLKHHPDKGGDKEKMQEINAAKDALESFLLQNFKRTKRT